MNDMARVEDTQVYLAGESNVGCVPADTFPRDTDEVDPETVPELDWRGMQQWICGVTAAWGDADDWYVIDWGDGQAQVAHPDLRIRAHMYAPNGWCANLSHTAVARPLHRDGTTGPAVARSFIVTRGWGEPQHEFRVFDSDPARVFARLFRKETPLGYGVAWDPGGTVESLPDGESNTDHTYPAGPPRSPSIGVVDRPARRLRWFGGPTINKDKKTPTGNLTAWFGVETEWDGGYSGQFHVANHTDSPLLWQVDFSIDDRAVPREVWPSPTAHMRQLRDGRWRVWSDTPIPADGDATIGMRVEPAGTPTAWPDNIQATKHHEDT